MPSDLVQNTEHANKEPRAPGGLLASMRIRKKLIFLHTVFSILLTSVLLISVRPAVNRAVSEAEGAIASRTIAAIAMNTDPESDLESGSESASGSALGSVPAAIADLVVVERGSAEELGVPDRLADRLLNDGGGAVQIPGASSRTWRGIAIETADGSGFEILAVGARLDAARRAAMGVYVLIIVALIAVYALIAVSLEVFVLPQHVYRPIRLLLAADRAVQRGETGAELVDERTIPADEMGEIMRSRNNAIRGIRRQETALANALDELEVVAADLKRKNHLLENARRNLEGADRLMSLGMMSAGIAHELNTPLSVAKGLVERLIAAPDRSLSESQAALLGRVVGRLEKLSDGLLDFARARHPAYSDSALAPIVAEAVTLVRLDREAGEIDIRHTIDPTLRLACDADRMVQVFVNLIRNAVDAIRGINRQGTDPGSLMPSETDANARSGEERLISIEAEIDERDGSEWVIIRVADTGPGIDPEMLSTLFEPFVSSRLDSKGTGLGLAVAEGIVREHAGTLIARNRQGTTGAVFEIVVPRRPIERGMIDHDGPIESRDDQKDRRRLDSDGTAETDSAQGERADHADHAEHGEQQ